MEILASLRILAEHLHLEMDKTASDIFALATRICKTGTSLSVLPAYITKAVFDTKCHFNELSYAKRVFLMKRRK